MTVIQTILALDYITVVGESISIVCLAMTIVVFYWVRTLQRDFRFTIHRNLCWNLLIAEILLLAGVDATYNPDLCLSIAVFLHLFFLCAFGWMFIEGLYMYLLLVKVIRTKSLIWNLILIKHFFYIEGFPGKRIKTLAVLHNRLWIAHLGCGNHLGSN